LKVKITSYFSNLILKIENAVSYTGASSTGETQYFLRAKRLL